jgi:hypothetical protein
MLGVPPLGLLAGTCQCWGRKLPQMPGADRRTKVPARTSLGALVGVAGTRWTGNAAFSRPKARPG